MMTAAFLLLLQSATLHIEKNNNDRWQFIMECSFREEVNQNAKAQLLYQDTVLKKYYPLKFFEDEKELKINGDHATIILSESYKEPFALNYKAVLILDNSKVIESHLNNYDEGRLRSQVKHSTIGLYNDFITLNQISYKLLQTYDTELIDIKLFTKLAEKNSQRVNLQSEAPIESRGKFAIEILIELLLDIKDKGYSKSVRKEKIVKFSGLLGEYFNSLGFYFIDGHHAGKILEKLKNKLLNNDVPSELLPLIIELSNILPEFTHGHLKKILSIIHENNDLKSQSDKINTILETLTEMIRSSQQSLPETK